MASMFKIGEKKNFKVRVPKGAKAGMSIRVKTPNGLDIEIVLPNGFTPIITVRDHRRGDL